MLAVLASSVLAVVWAGFSVQSRMKSGVDVLYQDSVRYLTRTTQLNGALGEVGWRVLHIVPITRAERIAELRTSLFERLVPAVDRHIVLLRSVVDDRTQRALADEVASTWETLKGVLRSAEFELTTTQATEERFNDALAEKLTASLLEVRSAVAQLQTFMIHDARMARDEAVDAFDKSRRQSMLLVVAALSAGIGGVVLLIRDVVPRVRRYSRFAVGVASGNLTDRLHAKGSDELADLGRTLDELVERRLEQHDYDETQAELEMALQVAENEEEAHTLLKRHLERSIPGVTATVLNRNNSANRLLATTELPQESELTERLRECQPRACLAVRLSRSHDEVGGREPLVSCPICDHGRSSRCEPLLVGGEVIGAVLVEGDGLDAAHLRRVSESVAAAAPVLANLRNLALAEHRALTDALTGLPNQRASRDTLLRMVAQASRSVHSVAAILLDLDHFKQVNDLHGHETGDQALAAVAAAITSSLRTSDFAGRYGGEEFVLLLPDTGTDGAVAVAENARRAIERLDIPGLDTRVTASFGVAVFPADAGDADALVRQADRAMYAAKAAGRNRVTVVSRHVAGSDASGSEAAVDEVSCANDAVTSGGTP